MVGDPITHVEPKRITVSDIDYGIYGSNAAHFIPHGYDCTITLSPYIVRVLFQWAVRNNFLVIDGEVTYITDHSRRKVRGDGKQETDEEKSCTSS